MTVLVNYFKGPQVECLKWACVDDQETDFLLNNRSNGDLMFDFTFVLQHIIKVTVKNTFLTQGLHKPIIHCAQHQKPGTKRREFP